MNIPDVLMFLDYSTFAGAFHKELFYERPFQYDVNTFHKHSLSACMFPQRFPVLQNGKQFPAQLNFVLKMQIMFSHFNGNPRMRAVAKKFASTSTHLTFARNLSEGQILRVFLN